MEPMGYGLRQIFERIKREHDLDIDIRDVARLHEEIEKQSQIDITKRFLQLERKRMFRSSVISDREGLGQTFDMFTVNNTEQEFELSKAKNIADRISQGETGNFTFSGKPGAGKTMLAISILNDINSRPISKTCLFVSMAMFMQKQIDASKTYVQQVKDDAYKIEMLIKKCDILVLDDLGSEATLQQGDNTIPQAYDSVQRHLFRIADYRSHKTNIITTNNSSSELQKIYNPKIYSRLIAKKKDNVIAFKSQDMRNI